MRIKRTDELLRQLAHPPLQVTDAPRLDVGAVLVVCAGFEDRAIASLSRAVQAGCRGFHVLCIEYLPTISENRGNEIASICEEACARFEKLVFDREDPAGAAERILERIPPNKKFFIDVSGMSRLLIAQIVSGVLRQGRASTADILYCSADDYPPTNEQVQSKLLAFTDLVGVTMFVSAGVFGLTIVPELSSVAMQGQPIRVIAFPSWNPTQLAAVCSEIQASFFTIVHGSPPDSKNHWRHDAIRTLNRVASLPALEEHSVSTLDYRETLELLLRVYAEHGQREKLVVAPTGSKMQTVAVGIACGFLRDLQIVYPTPRSFATPNDYTRGVGHLYHLPLAPFMVDAE